MDNQGTPDGTYRSPPSGSYSPQIFDEGKIRQLKSALLTSSSYRSSVVPAARICGVVVGELASQFKTKLAIPQLNEGS